MSPFRRRCVALLIVLLIAGLLPVPSSAAVAAATAPDPPISAIPSQVVIAFEPGTDEATRDAIVARRGGRTIQRLDSIDARLVELPGNQAPSTAVASVDDEDGVRYAQPNYSYTIDAMPGDTKFGELWGLHNTGQSGGTADADIDAPEAWNITTGSQDIVVGVVDTGIDYTHPDLIANMWTAPSGWNLKGCGAGTHGYRNDPGGTSCDPIDENSHGTHVAGTIGASGDNGQGVVGVNWSVKLMALRFFNAAASGTTAGAVDVIDYAVKAKQAGVNIRVLNNSWTGPSHDQALLDQINAANAAGILVVAAAGNVGSNNDVTPIYPASYPNVIAVAATDRNDALAGISNYGSTTVHLGAPGVSIQSTVLNGTYGGKTGTSMAAPHVSGAAALVISVPAFANLSVGDLRARLLACGDSLPALSGKTITGKRLNVARAVNGTDGCASSPFPPSIPVITTLNSPPVAAGGAGFLLTVNGSNFVPGSVVRWNGIDRTTTYVSASQLTAKIPATQIAVSGSADVTVYNPDPGAEESQPPVPFVIDTASQSIAFAPIGNKNYGDPDFKVSAIASSGLPISFAANGDCTVTVDIVKLTGVGDCTITASQQGDGTYDPAALPQIFSVGPASTTVAVPVVSVGQGAQSATLVARVTSVGNVNVGTIDFTVPPGVTTIGSLMDVPVVNGVASIQVDPSSLQQGAYAIEASYSGEGNFAAGSGTGFLSVGQTEQGELDFDPPDTQQYGDLPVPLSATRNSQSVATVEFSVTDGSPCEVNGNTLTITGAGVCTLTALDPGTAELAPAVGVDTIVIERAELTVVVADAEKGYGAPLPSFGAPAFYGFVYDDTPAALTGTLTISTTARQSSPVGNYPIALGGLSSENYDIVFDAGQLEVEPAHLTVSAADATKVYRASLPPLAVNYGSFAFGETVDDLSGTLTLTTAATQSSPVGDYGIQPGGLTSGNYDIDFDEGTLRIVPAAQIIAITPNPLPNRTLGDPSFTVRGTASSGLQVAIAAGPSGICSATGAGTATITLLSAGECTVTATQEGNDNYERASDVVRSFQIAATPSSPSPTPVPSSSPSPSPSPPLGTYYTLSLVQATGGSVTANPGPGQYLAGTEIVLTVTPGSGQVFIGWLVDGTLRSYAATVRLILSGNRVVAPTFAPRPNLGDVPANSEAYEAISQLAARGLYLGYGNNRYGPNDTTQRAQMAALIVRAMGWGAENPANPFLDRNGLDESLWRNVATLAYHGVAKGYAAGDCAAKGRTYPCFGPTDPVTYAETVTFITRAMVAKGYWALQPGAQQPYSGVPSIFTTEAATYYHYTVAYGGIPAPPANWSAQATRGWFARVLWVALLSQYGGAIIP